MSGFARFTLKEVLQVIDHISLKAQGQFLKTYAGSHEEYAKSFGRLEGISQVRKEFPHVAKELFNKDDED